MFKENSFSFNDLNYDYEKDNGSWSIGYFKNGKLNGWGKQFICCPNGDANTPIVRIIAGYFYNDQLNGVGIIYDDYKVASFGFYECGNLIPIEKIKEMSGPFPCNLFTKNNLLPGKYYGECINNLDKSGWGYVVSNNGLITKYGRFILGEELEGFYILEENNDVETLFNYSFTDNALFSDCMSNLYWKPSAYYAASKVLMVGDIYRNGAKESGYFDRDGKLRGFGIVSEKNDKNVTQIGLFNNGKLYFGGLFFDIDKDKKQTSKLYISSELQLEKCETDEFTYIGQVDEQGLMNGCGLLFTKGTQYKESLNKMTNLKYIECGDHCYLGQFIKGKKHGFMLEFNATQVNGNNVWLGTKNFKIYNNDKLEEINGSVSQYYQILYPPLFNSVELEYIDINGYNYAMHNLREIFEYANPPLIKNIPNVIYEYYEAESILKIYPPGEIGNKEFDDIIKAILDDILNSGYEVCDDANNVINQTDGCEIELNLCKNHLSLNFKFFEPITYN